MSDMNPIFPVNIEDGMLTHEKEEMYNNYVISRPNGRYELVLRRQKKIRSLEQNAYFHGVIVKMLSDELGYDTDFMKDILKSKFLTKEIVIRGKDGKEELLKVVLHSADLSTVEFEDFTRLARQFGDNLGIYIPLPNEVDLSGYQPQ